MRTVIEAVCLATYLVLTIVPGIYGLHLCILMYLTHRRAKQVRAAQQEMAAQFDAHTTSEEWPRVTTQVPLYNEVTVARRVIEAAADMDYPPERHEVQILDDSTDETREVVDQVCSELRALGKDVKAIRRANREHYKAGALANGLASASGEYVAVFDADFVPDRQFLRRLIPLIANRPDACCAQGRWGHLNADESWMTEALALGMDGHFGVEQCGRAWNNLLLNFNGTGGIWRKAAIEDPRVGGWQGDTLTEDLDLSYRAQLAGWKVLYSMDVVSPAEVPADVNAIKSQQRRWATGSIQTARKLLPAVWRSQLSFIQKLEATIHLTQYSVAIFMVLIPVLARPVLMPLPPEKYFGWLKWIWCVVPIAAAAPSMAYIYGRWLIGGGGTGILRILKLIMLGLGLSVNNCAAVIAGAVQRGGEFIRTPKSGSIGRGAASASAAAAAGSTRPLRRYASLRSNLWLIELSLGLFCLFQWAYFLPQDRFVFGSFYLLYAVGLILLGWGSRPVRASATGSQSGNLAAGPAM